MFLVTVDPSSRVNVQVSVEVPVPPLEYIPLITVAKSLVPGVGLVPS